MNTTTMASAAAPFNDLRYRAQDWAARRWANPAVRKALLLAALLAIGGFWGAITAIAGTAGLLMFVSALCCIFILRDFRVGVAIMILIMPIAQSYAFPHEMFGITGLNPLNLLLVSTLAMYMMRAMGTRSLRHFFPRPLFLLLVVPMIVGAVIGAPHAGEIPAIFREFELIFFSEPVGYVRDMLLKPLTFVVFALLVSAAVWRSRKPERFITPMLVSCWIMAFLIIGFVVSLGVHISDLAGTYTRQVFAPLGMHANDLGRLYVVAYALLLFIWDRTPNLTLKLLLLVSMGLVTASLILTFSRGSFVGWTLVNVIWLLSRRNWKTIGLAVIALPVFLALLPGAVWDRIGAGKGEGADGITAGRTNLIWEPLVPEMFDHPLIGNGLGAVMYSNAMKAEAMPSVSHPHNAFLETWLDLGAFGMITLLAFWGHLWTGFRRMGKDPRLHPHLRGLFEGAAAGIVSFLVAGFAGSSLMPAPEQAFLWFAVGMMYGMRLRLKYGSKEGA